MSDGKIDRENLKNYLLTFMKKETKSARQIAKAIGCTESSVKRIIEGITYPSDEMIRRCGVMMDAGYKEYSKLTEAQKEKISDTIGAISGGALGFASITAAISASGTVIGLSAAGITSGLAAIGGIVGAGMVGGVVLLAAAPVAVGVAGFGLIKGIKAVIGANKLNNTDFDSKWEIRKG